MIMHVIQIRVLLCTLLFSLLPCMLWANELVRGKIVEKSDSRLVIRQQSGDTKTVRIDSATKLMHKAGSGEQSEPPGLAKNMRVAASLKGRTAVFVVVEEVPK